MPSGSSSNHLFLSAGYAELFSVNSYEKKSAVYSFPIPALHAIDSCVDNLLKYKVDIIRKGVGEYMGNYLFH